MFFVSCCDSAEVSDFTEEALDLIAIFVEETAEARDVLPVRHRLAAGPGTPAFEFSV